MHLAAREKNTCCCCTGVPVFRDFCFLRNIWNAVILCCKTSRMVTLALLLETFYFLKIKQHVLMHLSAHTKKICWCFTKGPRISRLHNLWFPHFLNFVNSLQFRDFEDPNFKFFFLMFTAINSGLRLWNDKVYKRHVSMHFWQGSKKTHAAVAHEIFVWKKFMNYPKIHDFQSKTPFFSKIMKN